MSTSLTRPRQDMRAFADLMKARQSAMAAVAANHLDPERVTRIVLGCVAKTPKLQDCTVQSIVRSVMQSVELGLEPGSALGQAYLVPFGNECTLIIGYRGLLDLMRRTGDVASVTAQAVYDGDEIEVEFGLEEKLRHVPIGEPEPDKLKGAYAVVRFRDGSHQMGYMTRKQIESIRKRSRAGNSGPWVTDYAEMARKTVLRNVAKWCPMSSEMAKAQAVDVAADTGDTSGLVEFELPDAQTIEGDSEPVAEPETTTTRVRNRIKHVAASEPEPKPQPEPEPDVDPFADTPVESPLMDAEKLRRAPYNRATVATQVTAAAVALGVLNEKSSTLDVTNLRDELLPELGKGGTWGDVTEELYGLLMSRLYARVGQ